ncbi:hypothetical protein J2S62_002555 [Enteractinococcus fodinae]|uniref:Uncharacterized protein n=1 Tax=Enteractinococcus fodinae TaxID=684663 RepID=A0ABU2B3X5_9MICC|nr:hypothetical protein [Enteractinococcus fodinae]
MERPTRRTPAVHGQVTRISLSVDFPEGDEGTGLLLVTRFTGCLRSRVLEELLRPRVIAVPTPFEEVNLCVRDFN